jgi:hypothetical protein
MALLSRALIFLEPFGGKELNIEGRDQVKSRRRGWWNVQG